MKRPLILAALLFASTATAGHAQDPPQPPVPMSYFPHATDLTYLALVANRSLDCSWGFDCNTGQVLFHTHTEGGMGRVWGWGELLNWATKSDTVDWVFYVSYYQKTGSAAAASRDFVAALRQNQGHATQAPQFSAPDQTVRIRTDSFELYALTFVVGSVDFEGVTSYALGSKADQKTGRTGLVRTARFLANQLATAHATPTATATSTPAPTPTPGS